jgi:hypothetical protein
MGVVNETVQDGVGIARIADYFVPVCTENLNPHVMVMESTEPGVI